MTYTPIPRGTTDWDVPVNDAFTSQDSRITVNEAGISSLGAAVSQQASSISTINTAISRLEWRPDDYSWIGWSFDPVIIQNPINSITGTVYMMAIIVRVQTTVTNIITNISLAGSSLTAGQNFVGLYDNTGNRLGVSADQTTAWGSIGLKTAPLVGGPVVIAPGKYWIAFLANGTVPANMPQPWSSASTVVIGGVGPASALNNANARFMTGPTGQTSLPASINIGTLTSIGQSRWFALS